LAQHGRRLLAIGANCGFDRNKAEIVPKSLARTLTI